MVWSQNYFQGKTRKQIKINLIQLKKFYFILNEEVVFLKHLFHFAKFDFFEFLH